MNSENTYSQTKAADFGLTERNLHTIRVLFQRYDSVKEVVIFGSRATGSYKQGSDIDLAIMNPDFDKNRLPSLVAEFEESDIPYFTDVVFFHTLSNQSLKAQITTHGKIIYLISDDNSSQ